VESFRPDARTGATCVVRVDASEALFQARGDLHGREGDLGDVIGVEAVLRVADLLEYAKAPCVHGVASILNVDEEQVPIPEPLGQRWLR
jgi:hypothetical protein